MATKTRTRSRSSKRGRRTGQEDPVTAYARQLVDGELPAGKYHQLAGARHLRDLGRQRSRTFPYRFDLEQVALTVEFFGHLQHYKGEWAGQPIHLEAWEVFCFGSIFGWVHKTTGLRRFQLVYLEIPRKNGKSLLAAVTAIRLGFFDKEPGAEVYCAATKRDQAQVVFGDAKQLVSRNPLLRRRIEVLSHNMHQVATASKLEALGADRDTLDGLNPSGAIIDEYHAHKTRGIVDVLETAMGARRQPLLFKITTAGADPQSPCGEEHHYATQVLERVLTDERYFAFITHADADDDPFDEATWAKANPNLDVSVKIDQLRVLATKAKGLPSALATFKQKRLNIWVQAGTPWLDLEAWRQGQHTDWTLDDLVGRDLYGGLDLSSKIDLSAFVLACPPDDEVDSWRWVPWFFMPEARVAERTRQDRVPYDRWVDEGLLLTTPGNRIDHDRILEVIEEQHDLAPFDLVGIDPWNAGNIPNDLERIGIQVVEVPQQLKHMSPPSKEFEALVKDSRIDCGGHPIMTWMASNVVARQDPNENLMPDKRRSQKRIDGIVAGIIAMGVSELEDGNGEASSAFEERGLW